MQQIDDVVLGPLEAVELLLTALRRALACLEILAPQDRVHVLEDGATLWVAPGWAVGLERGGTLVLERG